MVNVLKLHLELFLDDLGSREKEILKKYARMERGITRDILVPDTMTLHALHYAIQKAFGWQNSHLHHFALPEECFRMATKDSFGIWTNLCGLYFRFPTEDMSDLFWDDDYDDWMNFNSWLRKKYRGPYRYGGTSENYLETQLEVRDFYRRFPKLEICRPWNEWRANYENKVEKIISPRDATIKEVFRSVIFEGQANALLERLSLREILCHADQIPDSVDPYSIAIHPLTDRLIYEYDYGDNWRVHISLVEHFDATPEQVEQVQAEKPVCVARDGINVMDDVGGVYSFCEFLERLHEGEPEEKEQLRQWVKMFDWTGRMTKPERIL